MIERLGEERPGPLSIDPVTAAPRPEAPRAPERPRERVRPEMDSLPGNVGWTAMLRDSIESRFDKVRAWATTSGDRMNASFETMGASVAHAQQQSFERRADTFLKRQSRHDGAVARLEAKSGMWDLPIARSIKNSLVMYHSWRGHANGERLRRAEARAKGYERVANTADNFRAYFDDKVAFRADKIAMKWQAKLDAVRGPREEIDRQIEQMSEVVSRQEQLIERIRSQLMTLEASTGGNRSERRQRLQTLHRALATEEASMLDRNKILQGKRKHRIRLAAAEDTADDAIQSLRARYTKQPETEPSDAAEAAPSRTGNDAPAEQSVPGELDPRQDGTTDRNERLSIRELAEMRSDMTNEQIGKLWDHVFHPHRLPDGYQTLIGFARRAFPDRDIDDTPGASTSVADFLNRISDMYALNPEFKTYLQDLTGQRGIRALQTTIGRLETTIAFTDDIQENL